MAREVAAVLGKELKEPATDYTADDVKKENFKVSVVAQDICPRYTAHYAVSYTHLDVYKRQGHSPALSKASDMGRVCICSFKVIPPGSYFVI